VDLIAGQLNIPNFFVARTGINMMERNATQNECNLGSKTAFGGRLANERRVRSCVGVS